MECKYKGAQPVSYVTVQQGVRWRCSSEGCEVLSSCYWRFGEETSFHLQGSIRRIILALCWRTMLWNPQTTLTVCWARLYTYMFLSFSILPRHIFKHSVAIILLNHIWWLQGSVNIRDECFTVEKIFLWVPEQSSNTLNYANCQETVRNFRSQNDVVCGKWWRFLILWTRQVIRDHKEIKQETGTSTRNWSIQILYDVTVYS